LANLILNEENIILSLSFCIFISLLKLVLAFLQKKKKKLVLAYLFVVTICSVISLFGIENMIFKATGHF